jgi:hypothetical protein
MQPLKRDGFSKLHAIFFVLLVIDAHYNKLSNLISTFKGNIYGTETPLLYIYIQVEEF